jgi:hypothetical protein
MRPRQIDIILSIFDIFVDFFDKPYYVTNNILCILVIKKMNIISQASNQEEIDEIETIVQIFVVSSRIKQLAETA